MTDAARKIYFDSNILIAASEGTSRESLELKDVLERLRRRPGCATTSELTSAEVLGRGAPAGWSWQREFYEGLLVLNDFIDLVPVSRDILVATGRFRQTARNSGRRYKLPDAIHMITAMTSACDFLLTADKRLSGDDVAPTIVVQPDEAGLSRLRSALDA